jgi:hypothetical protein
MKKYILLLVFISFLTECFSQISNQNKNVVFSQSAGKLITKDKLTDYILRNTEFSLRNSLFGKIEMLTSDVSGEITTAFITIDKNPYLALVFYKDKFNQYGTAYKEYEIQLIKASKAVDLFTNIEKELDKFSNSEIYNPGDDSYLIMSFEGLTVLSEDPKRNPKDLKIYSTKNDMISYWSASNFNRTVKRFKEMYENYKD